MTIDHGKRLDAVTSQFQNYVESVDVYFSKLDDKAEALRSLMRSADWDSVFRLLMWFDDDLKKEVFPDLIDYASSGSRSVSQCRVVIKSLPRNWLLENLGVAVQQYLTETEFEEEPYDDEEEAYRRFAELLFEVDEGLLKELVDRAKSSLKPGIVEVAADFE